jgi:hypothetical protein
LQLLDAVSHAKRAHVEHHARQTFSREDIARRLVKTLARRLAKMDANLVVNTMEQRHRLGRAILIAKQLV